MVWKIVLVETLILTLRNVSYLRFNYENSISLLGFDILFWFIAFHFTYSFFFVFVNETKRITHNISLYNHKNK